MIHALFVIYVSNEDEIEKQAYGRTYSLIEFERFKHISRKHMSVRVYINERTYHFGMTKNSFKSQRLIEF